MADRAMRAVYALGERLEELAGNAESHSGAYLKHKLGNEAGVLMAFAELYRAAREREAERGNQVEQ